MVLKSGSFRSGAFGKGALQRRISFNDNSPIGQARAVRAKAWRSGGKPLSGGMHTLSPSLKGSTSSPEVASFGKPTSNSLTPTSTPTSTPNLNSGVTGSGVSSGGVNSGVSSNLKTFLSKIKGSY